ncbi:MAG: FAD-dependent thymidylate synthase [Gemmatimonadales bacterium]|nr:MAG: FAD-dependent thymidylate synthase [Gemmatimonadales bacterium]
MQTKRPTTPAAEEILGGYFPVLDHGFVSLVDYMGSDEDVERAARVSYGYGTRKRSATRGLVRYLRRHRHTTPSEMVEFKFHCAMPMFVARQWVRHRTASINEYSGRYSLMPLLFYAPEAEHFALQSQSNNQGREEEAASRELWRVAMERWDRSRTEAAGAYQWLLEEDVARELARIDLPLSTYTQWYWKIDLHNLLHFLTLRVDPHAQWEIQAFAQVMAGMVKRVAPLSYEAWVDYDLMGRPFSRVEREALGRLVAAGADGGIGPRAGAASISPAELEEMGLSPREVRELVEKLSLGARPDFELDLAAMRDAEEVAREMARAVPGAEAAREGGDG